MSVWIRRIVLIVSIGPLLVSCQRAAEPVAEPTAASGSVQEGSC